MPWMGLKRLKSVADTILCFCRCRGWRGALAAGASASVEGTIQNVTYKDEKSGYTVLKVAALHTAGAPPEQRRNAAQRQSRPINGTLSPAGHPIQHEHQAKSPSATPHSSPP